MTLLSKNKIKLITSLTRKKFREEENLFFAEGEKIVEDILFSGLSLVTILATKSWIKQSGHLVSPKAEIIECNDEEMKKVSQLKSVPPVIAVCQLPQHTFSVQNCKDSLTLVLDDIQDPGNMGTIIRLADWFGIETVIASKGSADAFNPKVVQASMGAICRVNVFYLDLPSTLTELKELQIPVYGTFLDGENIYTQNLSKNGLLIMGNEGKGISPEVEKMVENRIHIPSFSIQETGSESLNVAIATSIACSEFKRRI